MPLIDGKVLSVSIGGREFSTRGTVSYGGLELPALRPSSASTIYTFIIRAKPSADLRRIEWLARSMWRRHFKRKPHPNRVLRGLRRDVRARLRETLRVYSGEWYRDMCEADIKGALVGATMRAFDPLAYMDASDIEAVEHPDDSIHIGTRKDSHAGGGKSDV